MFSLQYHPSSAIFTSSVAQSMKFYRVYSLEFSVESSEMRVIILVKRLANCFSFVFAPDTTFILQLMTFS